jgi:hypothetical protein
LSGAAHPPELPDTDSPVGDDVLLYRLVPIRWCDVVDGQWEFQSGAFDNSGKLQPGEHPDDMSVVLGDTLEALQRLPDDLPARALFGVPDELGVAVLRANFVRAEEEQEVRRSPNDDEPAHGDVRGKKGAKRRKRLKKHAEWIVRPAAPPALP